MNPSNGESDKASQELSLASKAPDRLFNDPMMPINGTITVFSAKHDDFTQIVIQNQTEVEVIAGNPA